MKQRRKKLTPKQYSRMVARTQRYVDRAFFYRRASWPDGPDRYGFLGPTKPSQVGAVVDLANHGAQHWEVLVIVYCEDAQGNKYRQAAFHRTEQRFAAWRMKEDEHGKPIVDEKGHAEMEDQLMPIIKACKEGAEAAVNHNHVKDIAVVMRPWSKQWPSMEPVLRKIQKDLDLEDWEVVELPREEEAA